MQIQTVTVPAWAAPMASLQQGYVKWILDLLCLQQVTYCCAGLSAALEKPFKQDNLSASRHCSTRTKRWDKGAVWLGVWSNCCRRIKWYLKHPLPFVAGTPWRGSNTDPNEDNRNSYFHPAPLIPIYSSQSCCVQTVSIVSCLVHPLKTLSLQICSTCLLKMYFKYEKCLMYVRLRLFASLYVV